MDSNKIFGKIKELGHANGTRDELREYCNQKIEQITKLVSRRILNSDGSDILDCIFNGLPHSCNSSLQKKIKIINIVIETMRKESTSLAHCGEVISRLCLEIPRLPADVLVKFSNDSVQAIVEDSDVNFSWRDILPECLRALSSVKKIKHCGTELTSLEYKEQCVSTLCQCRWKDRQLVQLAAMFKDIQLSRENHKQVVNKICSYVIDVPPENLPPLLHQLLKLCKSQDVEIVLAHLSHYFSVRLYSKLEPPPQDSESTTMDVDDIVPHSPAELSRCLSTCIYHISQGAAEPELIRKHIKAWPKTQLLRNPFIIDLALAISQKGSDFKSACLDAIKSAIELRVTDEQRSNESACIRSVLPPDVDVTGVLKVLTTESANHRELTTLGLINLAFSLLSVSKAKRQARACWSSGELVLARTCKAAAECAPAVAELLQDCLATTNSSSQYAECLYVLCKLTPVSIERCSQLRTILESVTPSPNDYASGAAVIEAVHPLINFSTRTRDTIVMVCRKGLYSRDSLHRCLAVSGFLTVLRHARVPRSSAGSSQGASSDEHSHSYLTQLTVDLHATQQGRQVTSGVRNEAMCMEVVSILRRCLVQDAAVKQLLYSKIYKCAKDKEVLHESILELLYEQLAKYLPEQDSQPPLLLDKCVQIHALNAVLVEPISHLLFVISEFLQVTDEEDLEDILTSQTVDTSSAYLKSKLSAVIDQICSSDRFAKIDMEEPNLTDLTPESKAKCLVVQQALQCYEALIAHHVMQWSAPSTRADTLLRLHKAYQQLLDVAKAPSKVGKKSSKTSLNETKETQKSQISQKSQKEKGKKPVKVSNLVKDRAGPFKPLPCIWDLKLCLRVMQLLYSETVPWSSIEERNKIRSKREFHHFALQAASSVVERPCDKASVAAYFPHLARVMYTCCVTRFEEMCQFDDQTALLCLELFKSCLNVLFSNTHSLKMDGFLHKITEETDMTPASHIATILDHIHKALQQTENEASEDRDLMLKKLITALCQTACVLLNRPIHSDTLLSQVLIKLEDYVRTTNQECLCLIPALLAANSRDQQEALLLQDILKKLTSALGRIDEEDTSAGEESSMLPVIDSSRGHQVLAHVCNHLVARLSCLEYLLARARDLASYSPVGNHKQRIDKELHELYKTLIIQLCQVSLWAGAVCKLRVSVGAGSDHALAAALRLYALLHALAKHCPHHLAADLRFERLLKLSGKKLSSVIDNLIMYLEASQQQHKASKVLRDTKLIPRLVLEAEQFNKHVIILAGKTKVNYQQYMSLGTARDFRIRAAVLQEALQNNDVNEDTRNLDDVDINDAETTLLSPAGSDNEEENNQTTKKRPRLS